MMRRNLLMAIAVVLGSMVTGCGTDGTGVPYSDAVARVEGMLASRVGHGIFGVRKVAGEGQTTFRFIEGSRTEKIDHATPLRVEVTIGSRDDGRGSVVEVEAHQHGIKLKRRDHDAESRWQAEAESAVK